MEKRKFEIVLYDEEIEMLEKFIEYKCRTTNRDWSAERAIKVLFASKLGERLDSIFHEERMENMLQCLNK